MNKPIFNLFIFLCVIIFTTSGNCELPEKNSNKLNLKCEIWFQSGDTAYSGLYLKSDRVMNGKFLDLSIEPSHFVRTTFTAPDLFEGSMLFGVYQYRESHYPGPGPEKILFYLKQYKETNPIQDSKGNMVRAIALAEADLPLVKSAGKAKLSLHSHQLNLKSFRVECSID